MKIYKWYCSLSKRVRDSISAMIVVVGFISTILTILGVSLNDIPGIKPWTSLLIFIGFFVAVYFISFAIIGKVFKEKIDFTINQTPVKIFCGDIFKCAGWKVIGCDTCFRTQIDDVVISKSSLHGRLVLEHGKKEEIDKVVQEAAKKLKLKPNSEGLYRFPLGTIIPYESSMDHQTYLMLALTELNKDFEAHITMANYEYALMRMWKEISRVYASNDIVFPILGDGITRFDDGPKNKSTLIKCMICTFGSSGIGFNSKINIVIYGDTKDIPLYELRDVVKIRR